MLFSDKDWNILCKYFDTLTPIRRHVENDRRMAHYLERIFAYTNRASNRTVCRQALNRLDQMFPMSMSYLRAVKNPRSFSSQPKERVEKLVDNMVPAPNINFYRERVDPYKNRIKQIRFKTDVGPTVNELQDSLAKATHESFKCKSELLLMGL